MAGSPGVFQTVAPFAPDSRGDLSSARAEQGGAARRPRSAISRVAWVPQRDLGQAEWFAAGRKLGAVGRCSQWWIGDWIRYGNARWGEKYTEAARVTGYDVASLRNMAWVAAQFDSSLRSDKLSWSHHVLLAPLSPDQQQAWIERAIDERLSVADLRLELRARGYGNGRGRKAPAADERREQGEDVCPHCGHRLSEADS